MLGLYSWHSISENKSRPNLYAFVKGKSSKLQDYDPDCVYLYFDYGVDVSVLTAWMLFIVIRYMRG